MQNGIRTPVAVMSCDRLVSKLSVVRHATSGPSSRVTPPGNVWRRPVADLGRGR